LPHGIVGVMNYSYDLLLVSKRIVHL